MKAKHRIFHSLEELRALAAKAYGKAKETSKIKLLGSKKIG